MWLIYFDASFSNFKIGKICWNSSRIWTQIPHKWYWNHPLPAFREVLLISFYGLRVEWEMSARSDSAGEARPLLPLICVHQTTLGTAPSVDPRADTTFTLHQLQLWARSHPRSTKHRINGIQNIFVFSEVKMEMMAFEEDAGEGTHLDPPTPTNQSSVPAESLSKTME